MWPFRRRRPPPEPEPQVPAPEESVWEIEDGEEHPPMTDEELNALMFEQDRLFAELEAQVERLGARLQEDRSPVEIMRCTACGVYGEHLLDRDGFPAECRSCGWEGGAV